MKREAGHLLVGLMVLVAVMLILLTVAGQSWVFIMRRDAEAELIFRGEEYARAIAFYQKETGSFPLELKLLMQPGPHRHRFIRKLYKDPLQEDGSWGKIFLSPTGKGFINPYASRRDLSNPFGDAGGGSFGGGGGARGGLQAKDPFADMDFVRKKSSSEEDISGYSEMTPEEFESRGGDQQGLPIVGVVHKTKESGLKIYKNLANLNDWAFTTLLEGQETLGGPATGTLGTNVPLQKGIGDHTSPFTLNPGAAPKERNLFEEREKRRREMLREQREKEQQEREEGQGEEEYQEDDYEEEEPPPDEETPSEDEEGEEGEEDEEEDPNQPS